MCQALWKMAGMALNKTWPVPRRSSFIPIKYGTRQKVVRVQKRKCKFIRYAENVEGKDQRRLRGGGCRIGTLSWVRESFPVRTDLFNQRIEMMLI